MLHWMRPTKYMGPVLAYFYWMRPTKYVSFFVHFFIGCDLQNEWGALCGIHCLLKAVNDHFVADSSIQTRRTPRPTLFKSKSFVSFPYWSNGLPIISTTRPTRSTAWSSGASWPSPGLVSCRETASTRRPNTTATFSYRTLSPVSPYAKGSCCKPSILCSRCVFCLFFLRGLKTIRA